jgi:hypothetical protein
MTEEHKLMFCILFIVAAIIVVARYPALLFAFTRKATARCRDGNLSFSIHPAARARIIAALPNGCVLRSVTLGARSSKERSGSECGGDYRPPQQIRR